MTLDQLQQRDRRIAQLEALTRDGRTAAEDDELHDLIVNRDGFWRRMAGSYRRTREKLEKLEAYARQHKLDLA